MGSKKHKKESKKKKHRSRSRSPLDGEERERKRHKKHKDRKKDRSPDVEEVPVDSHLVPERTAEPRREAKEARDTRREERHESSEKSKERSPSPAGATGGGGSGSLSIEDTNRLRAKLGLKPLEVKEKPGEDGKIKDDLGEFYHKPAVNITQQKKTEKIKERLEERKEKRKMEQKLKTTLLAEQSDDEDALEWVKKSRQIEQQKKEAAKRAAMLDEMDEVFGVSALVADDERQDRGQSYTHKQLHGLKVGHDIRALGEEREVVLTLADKEVLADDEDVLVNVNIVDEERYKKNIVERKKAASGYQAYDEDVDMMQQPGVLTKYDEEIDPKAAPRAGFRIGQPMDDVEYREREQAIIGKRLESLQTAALRPASDYLDYHEIKAKFKKPRKKGKMRQKPKQEPIDVDDYDKGNAPLDTDDTDVKVSMMEELPVDDEETEPDVELQAALARARRLRQTTAPRLPKMEELLENVKEEDPPEESEEQSGLMILDATAEFCRTLGAAPAYRVAKTVKPDSDPEDMEVEPEPVAGGAWSRVDTGSERPAERAPGPAAGLAAEPALGAGVAGALRLALSKGYLEKPSGPPPRPTPPQLLQALHYSIEDKAGEDDKYSRRERERGGGGPLQEFREKTSFKPRVTLDYADDEGRPLPPKEAFRYLSHKFHGKGPGKNKQEKRLKKQVQEALMKKMSSTDTPLNTLQMLQDKQRETHSAYVVLSGAKRDTTN